MGKVVKFTGSRLLGEELRRLRGGRTLDDIVELGRSRLADYGFKSVAKATLSEIENGRTLPNIESVFALSVLYQVPTSRFLHILLEENLVADAQPPSDPQQLHAAFAEALTNMRLTEALALALHGIKTAAPGWESLRWRLNRATAIEWLGMRQDAIAEVNACLEHPAFPARQRYKAHMELAWLYGRMGQFQLGEMHAREAVTLAPDDLPTAARRQLLEHRVALALRRAEWGSDPALSRLDEVEEWLSAAMDLSQDEPALVRLGHQLSRATVAAHRGRIREARQQFRAVLESAQGSAGLELRAIEAHRGLAALARHDDPGAARTHLMAAATAAVDLNFVDLAFLSSFELAELAESPEQRAMYIRRCRRLYPLVRTTHPAVLRYEQSRDEGGA